MSVQILGAEGGGRLLKVEVLSPWCLCLVCIRALPSPQSGNALDGQSPRSVDKDTAQPEDRYLIQADGKSSLRHKLDLQFLLSPLETKTSQSLVGINEQRHQRASATVDLLLLGLLSLLFLCALVHNRPLRTETCRSKTLVN